MKTIYSIFFIAGFILTGCNKESSTSAATSPAGCVGAECKTINESESYYDQFMSEVEGTCEDSTGIRFRAVATVGSVKLASLVDRDLVADFSIHLVRDGQYVVDYQEILIGQDIVSIVFEQRLTGRWFVDKTKLTLEGFGVGNKLVSSGKSRILFKVQKSVHDNRITSPMIALDAVALALGPDGETGQQYCESLARY